MCAAALLHSVAVAANLVQCTLLLSLLFLYGYTNYHHIIITLSLFHGNLNTRFCEIKYLKVYSVL